MTLGYDVREASGPYVFRDDDLSLVYADPSFDYAMNARVQRLHGKDYLTFWHGSRNRGDSQGFCVGYDENYRLAWNVTLDAPFTVDADMHECEVTPDGTVLLTAYQDKKFDLTPLGGKLDDVLADGCYPGGRFEGVQYCFHGARASGLRLVWAIGIYLGLARGGVVTGESEYTTSSGIRCLSY